MAPGPWKGIGLRGLGRSGAKTPNPGRAGASYGASTSYARHAYGIISVMIEPLGDLIRSAQPHVERDGKVKYDRPPFQARLTKGELAAKSRIIMRERWNAGLAVFFTRHGKVIRIPPGHDRRPW